MTPQEAEQAVADGATVSLRSAHDRAEYAVGRAVAYSLVPTITIELSPGGSQISWRHDLAEIVKPPRPEEPTGLGAVVEDASGVEHIHLGSGLWAYGTTDGPSGGMGYADIDAVKVLSEGVTP